MSYEGITIEGLSETIKGFQDFNDKIAKNQATGAKLAANAYKNDVQVIAPYKTGTYRRSIHVETTETDGETVALVGTDLPYAKRLEFGFVDKDKLGRVYNQAPRPHFRPALDENRDKYLQMMKEAMFR